MPYHSAPEDSYTIAIQPICNEKMEHVADELLYRASAASDVAIIENAEEATARACAVAFYEMGIDQLSHQRLMFVNAPQGWLLRPELSPLPPERVVIEILEDVAASTEVRESIRQLRRRGYRIALDDFVLTSQNECLVALADIIKIDIRHPPDPQALALFHRSGAVLLAERIETHEQFEAYLAKGFSRFQGFYLSRPQVVATPNQRRSCNQAAQLKLFEEIFRDDFNVRAIIKLVSQDPYLVAALFRRANSPFFQRCVPASNLEQCITRLGMLELRTLVATLLLARNGPASRLALLEALTRSFMCGQLAKQEPKLDPMEGLTIGFFSMMDTLLGLPLDEILTEVRLSHSATAALLHGQGPWSQILDLVCSESGSSAPTEAMEASLIRHRLAAATRARELLDGVSQN